MKNWLWIIGFVFVLSLHAEDGHRLWLRMERNAVPADVRLVEGTRRTAILDIASRELKDFWKGEGRVLLCVSKGGATRDGFTIRKKGQDMELSSASDRGVLYAAYDLLRRQQTGDLLSDGAVVTEMPSYDIRILNHWDNPDGTVERGYAGRSIWKWDELPETVSHCTRNMRVPMLPSVSMP